jgi:GrpB-like predicted nucleotidyltransferase (UPF0157 family)
VKPKRQAPRIQLVGGQSVLSAGGDLDELIRFYGGLFGRLTKEVGHTGHLTRYVGYQSPIGRQGVLHFVGIEVDQIEGIPEGMVAWDLTEDTWMLWTAGEGQDILVSKEKMVWQWLEQSPSGRWHGEFTARLPVGLLDEGSSARRDFWVSANAYVGQESDVSGDEVYLVDYDPSWPRQYAEFARWLRDRLGSDVALRIEHYGSTAIPGMPAKPIIDVLVQVPSFTTAKRRVVPRLDGEEWEYWWYSDHMTFVKREKLMGQRTHHVHMAPRGHPLWEGIVFRDYLRTHPEEAARYAALKRELAKGYREDREGYTQAKTEFVREVTRRAASGAAALRG